MKIFFLVIHFLVTALLVASIAVQSSKSEGLGSLGGGSDTVYRGSSAKGFDALLEKWTVYLAYGFLGTAFLSAIIIPRFF